MKHEIETIGDLMDVVTEENVELLKNDLCEFLDYVLVIRSMEPLGVKQTRRFIWNDDGVKGIKAIHTEIVGPSH